MNADPTDLKAVLDELSHEYELQVNGNNATYDVSHMESRPKRPPNAHMTLGGQHYVLAWIPGSVSGVPEGGEVRLFHQNRNDQRTFITRVERIDANLR